MPLLRAFRRLSGFVPGLNGSSRRVTRSEFQELSEQVKAVNKALDHVSRRESQLRAVLKRESELQRQLDRLTTVLENPALGDHIVRSVRRAELCTWPFPYAVIDDVLPRELYHSLIRGLPPVELFGDRRENKQQLSVPFELAPTYSQRVWQFLASVVAPKHLVPALTDRFREPLEQWIAENWPEVPPESVHFHNSDGRILLRRRGYRIPPHRDPKWGFLTCILYLARDDSSESWGTQLFTVEDDTEARGAAPHWIDAAKCKLVGDVAFRQNRMLVFLNSVGAHGAEIPADAEPADLERYIYQFRIGPTEDSMTLLTSTMSEERRPIWAGKISDY